MTYYCLISHLVNSFSHFSFLGTVHKQHCQKIFFDPCSNRVYIILVNAFDETKYPPVFQNKIKRCLWMFLTKILVKDKELFLQVNLFQKHLFLHQLTHNMAEDWITSLLHENCKLRTCWEHIVYIDCSECQNKKIKKLWWQNFLNIAIFMY